LNHHAPTLGHLDVACVALHQFPPSLPISNGG